MDRPLRHPLRQRAGALALTLALTLAACGPNTTSPTASSIAAAEATPAEATETIDTATEAAANDSGDAAAVERPAGWTDATHGDDAEPDYAVVFPQDAVNEITITIDPADWAAMQADMVTLLGEQGTGGGGGFGDGPPDGGFGDGPPGGGGRGGDMTPTNPMWVPATITFAGQTWTDVGVRYKGNSSLTSAWRSGSDKLPLKVDFDEFEAENPAIDNQRFYGFKQLSLSSNFGDPSYLRETVTYDLLDEAGLVAAETALYQVTLDYGEGPVSLGVYTVVEVIDDTVVERYFGENDGNIYEADGSAASLATGTEAQIATSFQKENNEDAADWSDVEALYTVLHSELRTTDPEAWRAQLEALFDVDSFLEWLGLATTLQHWDTYGGMSHNYYLYNDPDTGRLTWISWDHNFVLGASAGGPGGGGFGGPGGGGPGGGGPGGRGSTSFDKAEVGDDWPLIRYLLDDPTYYAKYLSYLEGTSALFDAEVLTAKYTALAAIVAPYAAADGGAEAFDAAIDTLTTAFETRDAALSDFLAGQAQ